MRRFKSKWLRWLDYSTFGCLLPLSSPRYSLGAVVKLNWIHNRRGAFGGGKVDGAGIWLRRFVYLRVWLLLRLLLCDFLLEVSLEQH